MSLANGSYVFEGFWINWSRGAIRGSTVTLSQRDGGLLTAFLGIYVTIAGAFCWKITSFALHQYLCESNPQDGLRHQQQAILRNGGTSFGSAWQLSQAMWYWKKNAPRAWIRSLPFILLALLNAAVFGVAGIFSSVVAKVPGNEALIRGANCGFLEIADNGSRDTEGQAALLALDRSYTLAASTYARACYDGSSNVQQCGQYIKPSIPWVANGNASCPFEPSLCWGGPSGAYEMDSGLMDSHEVFGINARESDRIQLRKVTTCSPIHERDFVNIANVTNDPTSPAYGDRFWQFYYGPIVGSSDYTYSYDAHSAFDQIGYDLEPFFSFAGSGGNAWVPISALNQTNADISLYFLIPNSVAYTDPVNDPFFYAPSSNNVSISSRTYFLPYYNVNALACADQFQLHNPTNDAYTPLGGLYLLGSHDLGPLTSAQNATIRRLLNILPWINTYYSVHSRGVTALQALDKYEWADKIQLPLPDNQWQIEVDGWFGVGMAKLQQLVAEYATGPPSLPSGAQFVKAGALADKRMCDSQIVRSSTGTISFSVLGLALVVILASMLIISGLLLDSTVGFLRRRFHWDEFKSDKWTADEKLQLQRLAFEGAGHGTWSGRDAAVPVTRKGDMLRLSTILAAKHSTSSERERLHPGPSTSVGDVDANGLEMQSSVGGK